MSYDLQKIEAKWQKKWAAESLHRPVDFSKKKKYYALVEFPYPSGSGLHMGHAFTQTIIDVFGRQKRMAGYNVLQPMGYDAFGLPTENYALKTGIHPAAATRQNIARFRQQMLRLGFAHDWDQEITTTDPRYYKWTQWIFLQFFKHGLAYKAETPVGWCPKCKIILANEEIVAGNCERCGAIAEERRQNQWLLRITAYADRLAEELDLVDYPDYVKKSQRDWIGRTEGVTIDYPVIDSPQSAPRRIACYSTRPDTNFGATFLVLSLHYPNLLSLVTSGRRDVVSRYIKEHQKTSTTSPIAKTGVFTGRYALNRLTNQPLPIWVADFVVSDVGTGAVVGVPAHDHRDFAFAKRYHLKIIPVVRSKKYPNWDYHSGPLTDITVAEIINSGFLNGFSPSQAKEKIISYLVKKGWGQKAVNYHLRDWIFSRQHYWGEPIPMIYCSKCAQNKKTWWDTPEGEGFLKESPKQLAGWFPVPEDQLPLKLPEVEHYQPTDTGESPLAKIERFTQVVCPECGRGARRETDTMPNWAGSSWYYLAYTFADKLNCGLRIADCGSKKPIIGRETKPVIRNSQLSNIFQENRARLDHWLPVNVYLGGAEHTTLHLLYSRFWHKFLNDLGLVPGKEPYAARRQHGVILGPDGARMSKSRGNVVNPEEIINRYGADTLRLYLLFMGPYDATMPWNPRDVEGVWRFLSRVYRLATQTKIPNNSKIRNQNIQKITHRTIQKVTQDIENLKFNTAIATLMEFVNELYTSNCELRVANCELLKTLVLLLAPFAPFMAEELWTKVLKQPYSVHRQPWPKYNPALTQTEESVIIVQINGKLRGQVKFLSSIRSSQLVIEQVVQMVQTDSQIARHLAGQKIKKTVYVPGKLINFVT